MRKLLMMWVILKKISVQEVSRVVLKKLQKLVIADSTIIWQHKYGTQAGTNYSSYLAEFIQNPSFNHAEFEDNGMLIECVIKADIDTLPLPAKRAITKSLKRYRKKFPYAAVSVQAEARCFEGKMEYINYLFYFFVSATTMLEDVQKSNYWLFYVSDTGHTWYPQFR